MTIEKIIVQKLYPIGPYANLKIGVEASVTKDEDINVAITDAEELLNNWFNNSYPNVGQPVVITQESNGDVFSGPIPNKQKVARNTKQSVLMPPDKDIRAKYARAAAAQDHKTIKDLETRYNFTIA